MRPKLFTGRLAHNPAPDSALTRFSRGQREQKFLVLLERLAVAVERLRDELRRRRPAA